MSEPVFSELLRYVEFGADDEAALRRLGPRVSPHLAAIADEFYVRAARHDGARRVLADAAQVARLKHTLLVWMRELFEGPWDDAYYRRRAQIGRTHVRISLPQRYMFGAMAMIRGALAGIAGDDRVAVVALHKLLDLELAIMLETYAEAYVDRVQDVDRVERDLLAVRTRRAERLASLGTMAAGLAHEIRNPLNAAHLQLTLVDRRLGRATPDVEAARAAATLADGEVRRLGALVGEFLDFARPQPLHRARADLRQTAEVIVALVAPEARAAGADLALEAGSAVLTEYDDEKIKQVLHNLVRNAVEATGSGGTVRIRVLARGASAVLEVEDDGPGIPVDAPVFEPFFTTKEAGTGLGLAIVHRICSDHGGSVDVSSRPGRTVVSASLPLDEA